MYLCARLVKQLLLKDVFSNMENIFSKLLSDHYQITDPDNFEYKSYKTNNISKKRIRGSVRSQLGKFLPIDQFERNKKIIKSNPLP